MADIFRTHIRAALADPGLQSALDANAERRLAARKQANASLTEGWDVLRQRAQAVRARVVANLPQYLDAFIEKVRENGFIVHQAAGAEQAVGIVLDIARRHEARLIAKSKTMVSEEIDLNHALEVAGLEVVETDLGEFIVQLRGEKPAHIITPAVHLRRSDVAQTLHDKLGLPLTDDIPLMTAEARRVLRQTFLTAGIGLSGVNFGVVETGSLCLVTNEGNGRLVTTIPPVHIALMGLERLAPTMEDLALMLALLPRSATGQKLSVYTSLIHGPRRAGDPDGALERHLIILDNGRLRLRASPLSDALMCIRCGACLNACPVFREIGGHAYVSTHGEISTYPGPIGSVISPGLLGQHDFGHLAQASSLCGACKEACPVDIDLPKLLLRVRAGGIEPENQKVPRGAPSAVALGLRVYTWFATRPPMFAAAQRMVGLFSRLASPRQPWLRLPASTGWGYGRDFPRPDARPFRRRWQSLRVADHAGQTSDGAFKGGSRDDIDHGGSERLPDSPGSPQPSLLERFGSELSLLGGSFETCNREQLPERLLDLFSQLGISSVQSWDASHLPSGLIDVLVRRGVRMTSEPSEENDAGLTGAMAGIAETGTLICPSGPGRPLSASLLPETHIAVLPASRVYATLSEVINIPEFIEPAYVALISGPSRTADIEMTLSIGVHGPRQVHVFFLLDE